MVNMLIAAESCKKTNEENFNKPLEMTKTKKALRKLMNVIFVIKNVLTKILK